MMGICIFAKSITSLNDMFYMIGANLKTALFSCLQVGSYMFRQSIIHAYDQREYIHNVITSICLFCVFQIDEAFPDFQALRFC